MIVPEISLIGFGDYRDRNVSGYRVWRDSVADVWDLIYFQMLLTRLPSDEVAACDHPKAWQFRKTSKL